jgi:N-glycosylase/DNA lyase
VSIDPRLIEQVVEKMCPEVAKRAATLSVRLWPEERLWEELTCCLLSSQVRYEVALAATQSMRRAAFFDGLAGRQSATALERRTFSLLSRGLIIDGRVVRYRFPRSRASQLARTHRAILGRGQRLSEIVYAPSEERDKRRWLVNIVHGFGPKQASMFLRNCGYSYALAVLDRHTLRFMHWLGLIRAEDIARTSSLAHYERLEDVFRTYAARLGYPAGYVDWAIWIVMRALSSRQPCES